MDLTAAAEANATSGWLEGWVGGLVAAAVTLAFTAWWESRQRRRDALDSGLLEVVAAADAFWRTWPDEPANPHDVPVRYWRLAIAVSQLQWRLSRTPFRWRRLSRRLYRSRRLGFAHELGQAWERLAELEPTPRKARALVALEISALCTRWQTQPWTFPRGAIE